MPAKEEETVKSHIFRVMIEEDQFEDGRRACPGSLEF